MSEEIKMRIEKNHRIIESQRSAQVWGRGEIAVVEDTSVGADAIRHE